MARERTTDALGKVTIEGRTYNLSHLEPFSFEFVTPEKDGRPQQLYPIDVLFSWPCFTRGIARGEDFSKAIGISRGRETRLFDERRYRFSRQLPGIVRDIGSRKCFHTGRGNFFTGAVVDGEGRRIVYTLLFPRPRPARPPSLTFRGA